MESKGTIVQKYGGTSLHDLGAIQRVAKRVVATRREGWDVVVVVSAMGHSTDELVARARILSPDPPHRELDMLLTTGEQTSMALVAIALAGLGEPAVSLTAEQCGLRTNEVHLNARILELRPDRVRWELAAGRIVVVAGFQGCGPGGERTTLGRGGSDTTAVALAAALDADRCEIYTDVDGVYTADPRRVEEARRLAELPYPVMEELAWQGAQVLKAEAVEFAQDNGVDVEVRSSWKAERGTRLIADAVPFVPRRPAVAGVAGRTDLIRLRLPGGWASPEARRWLLEGVMAYDLVFAAVRPEDTLELYLSDLEMPDPHLLRLELEPGAGRGVGELEIVEGLGAVSVVGFGMGSRSAGILHAALLENEGIEVLELFTSRESLSFVVAREKVDHGVRTMHRVVIERAEPVAAGD